MLTTDLTGNFGNHQLFYMFTRTVAETLGYEYGFNPTPSHDYYNGRQQMDFMDIDYGIIHDAKYGEMPDGIQNLWVEQYENMPNSAGASFHPYQDNIWSIPDNTKLVLRCVQDARYYEGKKEDIKNWFKIKDHKKIEFDNQIKDANVSLDKNMAVLNIRGGEYKTVPSLILPVEYWTKATRIMRDQGIQNFIVITDDIQYANQILPDIQSFHFGIGCDYYALTQAKNLILSNSSFAILPVWLSNKNPYVIAPKYWARHNISDGYWASSDVCTFGVDSGWNFMDRDGNL
jgi:hypothetical protein